MTEALAVPAAWLAPAGVRAYVTTRAGGVSAGGCASLNLASHVGDPPAAVRENRARVAAALALPSAPLWLRQVHGTTVVVHEHLRKGTDAPDAPEADAPEADAPEADAPEADAPEADAPEADAAVTFETGRVLAIQTADCLPVLLVSRDGRRLGAAHAGWRGLAAGVLERTVETLGVPGDELVAWLGPAIGPAAFEVGDEVRAAFLAHAPTSAAAALAFERNARGRWQADLAALARARLACLGVGAVAAVRTCTHGDAVRWYSHRRDPTSGRMATLAWLEPTLGPAPHP